MSDEAEPTRLFLITPRRVDLDAFPAVLAEALAAGDVAAVLIASEAQAGSDAVAAALVPVIQNAGAAAIIADDTRIAGRVKADGVHVATGLSDLRMAVAIASAEADRRRRRHCTRATTPWRPARSVPTMSSSAGRMATRMTSRIRRRSISPNGGRRWRTSRLW